MPQKRNGVKGVMDSKKLEIFMTAADLGSFSRASEVVGYTQSGLTHMMDSLEKEVGFPLLLRSHSGIQLSPQGERLMPAIREFLQSSANLTNCIQEIAEEQNKVIRVAAYASITMHWMPEILYRFRRICPDADIDLRMVDHAEEPFDLLKSGQTDVIFASRHTAFFCDWTPLYHEQMYAILPRDYPLNNRQEFPLQEFDGKPFLMPYGKFDQDVRAVFEPLGINPQSTLCRVDDETVIRMVSRGLGISMMSELMIRGNTDDVICLPVTPAAQRELGIGTHKKKPVTAEVRKLRDCVIGFTSEFRK